MTQKIREEIERRIGEIAKKVSHIPCHRIEELESLLSFLDTLEASERPEPYNPVYDESYLNEKIAKASKSWEGVDVDAMLAECRGYEPVDLEDAVKDYFQGMWPGMKTAEQCNTDLHFTPPAIMRLARHFYELGLNGRNEK